MENEKTVGGFRKYIWGWLCPVLVMFFIFMLLASIPTEIIQTLLLAQTGDNGFLQMFISYAATIGTFSVSLLYIRFTKKNRPIMKAIGRKARGNTAVFALFGALLGFACNAVCVLFSALNGDIYLSFDRFELFPLLALLLVVCIQSSGEELCCRAFLYQRLRKVYRHPLVAVFVNSVLFSLLHCFNPGVTPIALLSIFLTGILMSEIVYFFDSLWMACMFHTLWNFTQNIIFGLPNSGHVSAYSVFRLDASTARDSFFYNVGFGVESTAFACIVLAAFCLVIFLWGRKHAPAPTDVWAENDAETEPEK